MTVIRPNSIAGITSLTALGTAIDFYNVNGAGIAFNNVNLNNTSGVSTFSDAQVNTKLLIGSGTSTGTASQTLQVTGGAYVSGSLGIGVTNPSEKFHVSGGNLIISNTIDQTPNSSFDGHLKINGNGYNGGISLDSTGLWLGHNSAVRNIIFAPDETERVRIDSSGNLGVGAASPAAKTHIAGSASATTELLRLQSNTNSGEGNAVRLAFSSQVALDSSQRVNATIDALTEAVTSTHHGALRFSTMNATTLTERGRFTYGGYFKASNDGTYYDGTGAYHESKNTISNQPAHVFFTSNASYANNATFISCARAATSAYAFIMGYSGTNADIEFYIRGDGQAFADGSWTGGGADYAEYFEWEDGNPDNEDRRGCTVSLVGDKIKIAEEGDIIIGAISGNPSVVGDAAWNKWDGKYLTDDYGSYILEEHNVVEWTDEDGKEHSYEDWNLPSDIVVPAEAVIKTHDDKGNRFTHRKLNPEYNEMLEYIPRENRPEWDAVGLVGKLRVRKGQVIDSRWVKMKDISATVEEWLVR